MNLKDFFLKINGAVKSPIVHRVAGKGGITPAIASQDLFNDTIEGLHSMTSYLPSANRLLNTDDNLLRLINNANVIASPTYLNSSVGKLVKHL